MRVESAEKRATLDEGILANSIIRRDQDTLLVSEAIKGSEAAFSALFHRYQRRMYLIANRILRNREDAEDAVQQAFKRAFLRLDSFQGKALFSTWITRIALNEALQLLRKRRPGHVSLEERAPEGTTKRLDIEDGAANPEELYREQQLRGILNEAIGELRPIFRNVVQLYEISELPSDTISRRLGLSKATVKARAFRARGVLRRKLSARLGKPSKSELMFVARKTHARSRFRTTGSAAA
jgi:RNA polymerase sigma-70 factor, ECF subfamily